MKEPDTEGEQERPGKIDRQEWEEKNSERSREIKLRLLREWEEMTSRSPLPHEGLNWVAPEWFGDSPVPFSVVTAEGFDSEVLVERVERLRKYCVAVLEKRGKKALAEERDDLRSKLEKERERFEKNKRRAEELIREHIYPGPGQSQLRDMHLKLVNSVVAIARKPQTPEEAELVEIGQAQQVLHDDLRTRALTLWVIENVLERHERGLSNAFEAWKALYGKIGSGPFLLESDFTDIMNDSSADRRMELVVEKLKLGTYDGEQRTWKEVYAYLEKKCDRYQVKNPYSNVKSLRESYRRWRKRSRE